MAEEQNTAKPEIVIIRRRSGEDLTAAKGGAWKIAYADFVTAMMAFFLVMWLINAANEATRAQVASYFNPIKLTDSSTGGKGLNDPKEAKSKKPQKDAGSDTAASAAEKAAEEKLLADPRATLNRIAEHRAAKEAVDVATSEGRPKSVIDPFDPMAWQVMPEKLADAAPADGHMKPKQEETAEGSGKEDQKQEAEKRSAHDEEVQSPPENQPSRQEDSKNVSDQEEEEKTEKTGLTAQNEADAVENEANAKKIKVAQEIKKEILETLDLQPEAIPATVEVKGTDEGLLVSLVDKSDDGMFNVGSAEPNPKLIELVATIASVLRNHPGFIVIRGHTDSRPFRNKKYDNWQLSTARAHMAYYMLVRGGLDESRVRRVEGLADRDPKIPARPDAPENRRIDILLGQNS